MNETLSSLAGRVSPSVTKMIRMDHMHVLMQFHKLTPDTSDSVRQAAIRSILAALEIHAEAEEEVFYAECRAVGVQAPALERAQPEHDEMRRLIERVRGQADQPQQQMDTLCELMNAVMHHVADEETQLLPAAEKRISAERLSELGAKMTARKLELAKPRAGELAADMARAAPAKTALMAVGALVAGTLLVGGLRGRAGRHDRYARNA